MTKQKDIFLESEANQWFERNHSAIQKREFGKNDPIVQSICECLNADPEKRGKGMLLEVGCGEAKRLHWISRNLDLQCFGLEPSQKAVSFGSTNEVPVIQGTADKLEFENESFDFLVYGFCLYLCDRIDLFQIAKEAHRVLKPHGWLIIHDFFSETPYARDYHHLPGIFSYKMDYRSLFVWHPDYSCYAHSIHKHCDNVFTDQQDDWVATSIIRKRG